LSGRDEIHFSKHEKGNLLHATVTSSSTGSERKSIISAGSVEGLNNKAKLTTRKACGFRSFKTIKIALCHMLGIPPEPTFTHIFG